MNAQAKRLLSALCFLALAADGAAHAAEAPPPRAEVPAPAFAAAEATAPAFAAAEAAGRTAAPASREPSPELVRRPTFGAAGTVSAGARVIPLAGVAATALDLRCGAAGWPCGRAALTALQRFVRGRTLECLREGDGPAARCAVGGRDVGAWLVSQGWTAADGPAYAEAEKTARDEKRGIWSPARAEAIPVALTGGDASVSMDAVLRAEVALSTQSMTVTYRGEVIGEWPVSTARDGKETPTGAWTAKWLSRDHRSRLYDGAPMPYSIFFEGDYAIHGTYQTARLGRPASHGCVRLSPQNARLLFGLAAKEGVDNTLIVIRP